MRITIADFSQFLAGRRDYQQRAESAWRSVVSSAAQIVRRAPRIARAIRPENGA